MIRYDDDVRMFLEINLNKIDYFKGLDEITKQEIIYSLEEKTHPEGSMICKRNTTADRLFLIKSGIVEVVTTFDSRIKDKFIVEKLVKGAIINHTAFIVNDEADTDFICANTVVCYEITTEKMEAIAKRREDLAQQIVKVKYEVLN